jgi:hypothetical protein
MKYLFVDYDQGAGGEFFCANISLSPQCCKLNNVVYPTGRTKVHDMFDQEFLKNNPEFDIINRTKTQDTRLYNVVPTHRHTESVTKLVQNVWSIRIKNPSVEKYWKFLKHQQLIKVLLNNEPSNSYFIGIIKNFKRDSNNNKFVKHIKRNMDVLSILLLSLDIDPTEQNRQDYIEKIYNIRQPEPTFDYHLVIRYEDLFEQPELIKQQLFDIFGIEISTNWLYQYQQSYETYIAKT